MKNAQRNARKSATHNAKATQETPVAVEATQETPVATQETANPVTPEMLAMVRVILGEHGTCFHTGEKFVIGIPVSQYLPADVSQWGKYITNGVMRWGSNVEFEKALKYVSSPRSIKARGYAAERFKVAHAVAAFNAAKTA